METMRKDYLNGKYTHQEYYGGIAKEVGISISESRLNQAREAIKADKHMNNIPLTEWDVWASSQMRYQGSRIKAAFASRGDYVTQAGLVCMLKEAVREAITTDEA